MRNFVKVSQAVSRHARVSRPPVPAPQRHLCTHSSSAQAPTRRLAAPSLKPRYPRSIARRFNSAEAPSESQSASVRIAPERKPWRAAPHRRPDEPVYELYFTCKACNHRSGHSISKQGYHHGTTLVQCPSCKNRHLISDHLKIFSDKAITLQDIMKEKGEAVKLGNIDAQGDMEFWDEKTAEAAEGQGEPDFKT